MMKNMMKKVLSLLGYELRRTRSRLIALNDGYEIYQHIQSDGQFDYDQYMRVQTEGNKRKIHEVWVSEDHIAFLSNYIQSVIKQPEFGICHGTRNGAEQEWFRKYLDCDVIGTEISDNAEQFPHTIQWDFHETKPEWIGKADFIYSNAFDHSYDPERCLNAWMSCLRNGGICIIEHTPSHEHSSELDPFGVHISQLPYLILTWGAGRYFVREILDAPTPAHGLEYRKFLVVESLPSRS